MHILSRLSLAAILLLSPVLPAAGHEGHDHGAPEPAVTSATAIPTLEVDGSDVQLVALLQGVSLTLFIDRLADNSPVTGAEVTLSVDGGPAGTVSATADGAYRAAAPWAKPGDHILELTVTGGGVADLLVGTLTVPAPTAAPVASGGWGAPFLAGGAFLVGLVLGGMLLAWQTARRAAPALLLLALLAVPADRALAHEGHDHGPAVPEPVAGNSPKRLPDGSLFVPKATQRLLSIRTLALANGTVTPMTGLTGRVIADPNGSGRVQAPQSGRLMPPEGGFPLPGTRVKAGEVLGYVELVLRAEDGSGISEQLAGLDKDVRLAQQQWNRLSNLKGAVAQAEIDDARATLDGLTRQREALSRAVAKRVPLTAPIDGLVLSSNAIPGLMIEDRDVTLVFEIAEPGAVLIEALSFGGALDGTTSASADLNGTPVPLTLVGQGTGLAPGSTRLLYRPTTGVVLPPIGSLLSLSLPAGVPVQGMLLPREALVRGSDGLPAVLVHEAAQRFAPRTVRLEPAGPGSVRLLAGVQAGARIVVQGAALLAQIR